MDDANRHGTTRCAQIARRDPQHPRGTVYLIILISVMIITVIGLSGLYAAQVQGRIIRDSTETLAARTLADASIEVALSMINADPNWRSTLGGGDWFTDRPFARGSMTVNVRDPTDADVATGLIDPVVIRGTGTIGDARQMIEVTINAVPAALDSLDVAAAAGRIMAFNGSMVNADAVLSSNDSIWASAASVDADVETTGIIVGSSFNQSTSSVATPRVIPLAADVLAAYTATATPITLDEISAVSGQILENESFEFSPIHWSPVGCEFTATSGGSPEGDRHLTVYNRDDVHAGPAQDVTSDVINGEAFVVTFWARTDSSNNKVRPRLEITSDGDTVTFYAPDRDINGTWTHYTTSITPTWDAGDGLDSALFVVATTNNSDDIEIDGVSASPASTQPPRIEEVSLSAGINPFGAGTTNADAIYSIDCAGADLVIRNCRIHGTLVLIDPGPNSVIEQSVAWTTDNGMPALVVDGDISIELSKNDLDESDFPANFNPAGFGVGSEDADTTDKYASGITGLVYVGNDLVVDQQTRFDGVVIAGRDILFNGDDIVFTHDPTYAASPPTGFDSATQMILDRRSWTKVVD